MKCTKAWLSRPMLLGRRDPTTVIDERCFDGCQLHVDGNLLVIIHLRGSLGVPLAQVDHVEFAPQTKGKK